ncbi:MULTISPECIES: glycosyltransferase family A protein [Streptomyces]|uniref:Glycosyltransferase family A protein n=1 Tax=Streptomyces mirabilis TaxID=68239 RepID=A0ABU3UTM6_9ACTN|nr:MULTISPECIES: glycosyltransferase family A protein [Streptomyces]MDU8997262.1 glycosyltransferase family A protein [Streptomyces mirabilis]QDN87843.1 glycosyltransferase family 2 protein [Streptomyces sp. RLB3-6]QDO08677.1 glycosyltransferase family 2 protein [Streptomyces sp. S1D4-23]
MRHEMIICTRNRADDLRDCLESVAAQSCPPNRLIIVDSSETDLTEKVVHAFQERRELPVVFARAAPRKTVQMNVALEFLDAASEIVHFTDDDVILDRDYLAEILATFDAHPHCGGVGGRIANLPGQRARGPVRWVRCALLLDSRRQGALLPSGVNTMCRTGRSPHRVDWLSGCSMSYRRRAIAGLRFDETRARAGSGMDVDFSARVAAHAELIWTPRAFLVHRVSPIDRDDELLARRRVIRSRWRFARSDAFPVSRVAVLYAVLGETLMLLAMMAVFRSRFHLRQALANSAGVVEAFRGLSV